MRNIDFHPRGIWLSSLEDILGEDDDPGECIPLEHWNEIREGECWFLSTDFNNRLLIWRLGNAMPTVGSHFEK